LFHRWFGITRFVYNEALRLVTEGGWQPSFKPLKNYLLNEEKNIKSSLYPFVYDHSLCPRDAKDMAVKELCDAIAATKESLIAKHKNPNRFEIKRRTKKDVCQRFQIPVNGGNPSIKWNKEGFAFWSSKGTGLVKPYNKKELLKLPSEGTAYRTVVLRYERLGRYYLLIPLVTEKKENKNEKSIAFDPGVRTFLTGFSSDGNFVEYGKASIKRLFVLGKRMDELQSKIDKYRKVSYLDKKERVKYKNRRRKRRKEMGRISNRIKNIKRDMHWKISRDIVQEHKHILISRFQVSNMLKRTSRKINSETVRKMLQWSHFEFRQRLKHKAEELGSVVHEVGEHYSSKGCGNCGRIHWKLGGAKTFHCPYCHFKIDRDSNGARNILLMNLESHLILNPSLS
jgi:IS605 OrfB family transposase